MKKVMVIYNRNMPKSYRNSCDDGGEYDGVGIYKIFDVSKNEYYADVFNNFINLISEKLKVDENITTDEKYWTELLVSELFGERAALELKFIEKKKSDQMKIQNKYVKACMGNLSCMKEFVLSYIPHEIWNISN